MAHTGIQLRHAPGNSEHIAALSEHLGERVGLAGVMEDLNRQATAAHVPGDAVRWGLTWNEQDNESPLWWPQGISTSADASGTEDVHGRRMLMTTWYCKNIPGGGQGSRITLVDLETLRYRHVLLVRPWRTLWVQPATRPLHVHAGGLVWAARHLHVAGTRRGLFTCRLDDIVRLKRSEQTFGYHYVLPVRTRYRPETARGEEQMRYSFLSLDRSADPPALVSGEYGRGEMSTRLARFPLDPQSLLPTRNRDGHCRPSVVDTDGVGHMQGAVVVDGRYYISASRGRRAQGRIYAGQPGELVRHDDAMPAGPEDITYWPSTDQLWSLSEYPSRRFVFTMDRAQFD
ncbi:MAG TPA: hypothetical protein VJ976_07600 [Ornithinimicrobium sp.]|uniref:hypothetical protein n=1 Tax=Ornithinimicrobium sp. TaxID=1977084 RepID=UPI002B49BD1D|nr:hypothetical protein [Ornithinimicrobium sp.]HKJ12241.1 hypothetical protein [Ornithinimicrobium sp.]